MFSDKYGLTEAVLSGRKTQTRRVVSDKLWDKWTEYDDFCGSVGVGDLSEIGVAVTREYSDCEKFFLDNSPFKVGEVVAVAQSYKDAGIEPTRRIMQRVRGFELFPSYANIEIQYVAGWNNKLFVAPMLMPRQIRITNVRVERLQDISDEDCMAEGVCKWTKDKELFKYDMADGFEMFEWRDKPHTPREAYAALIDRISGKGTFERNPYVFVYEFELIK